MFDEASAVKRMATGRLSTNLSPRQVSQVFGRRKRTKVPLPLHVGHGLRSFFCFDARMSGEGWDLAMRCDIGCYVKLTGWTG